MFCTKCGAEIPDYTSVCPNCGAAVEAPPAEAQPAAPQPQPQFAQPQFAQPQYAPQFAQPQYAAPAAPVSDPRRTAARSPLFILAMIAMTAELAVNAGVFFVDMMRSIVEGYFSYRVLYYMESIVTYAVMTVLLIAAWLVFGKSRRNAEPLPVGGALSFVRAFIIIRLVLTLVSPAIDIIYDIIRYGDVPPSPSF